MKDATEQEQVKAAMASHAKIVVGDEKQRQNDCMAEVSKVLDRYDCALVPTMVAEPGKMEFFIKTIAKPRDARSKKKTPPMPARTGGQRDAANKEENP